jgi:hypothetical protein
MELAKDYFKGQIRQWLLDNQLSGYVEYRRIIIARLMRAGILEFDAGVVFDESAAIANRSI